MRLSLAISAEAASRNRHPGFPSRPLLAPEGPSVIIGHRPGPDGLVEPIIPAAETLFGPRGAVLSSDGRVLAVADTGHHRLLIWRNMPYSDYQSADIVIGQPDFESEGRNAKRTPSASTFNVPTGIAIENDVLVVADAWNHRVLIWTSLPMRSNQPADIVLGQADFASVEPNRGGSAGPHTLNWCYGATLINGRLLVADTGNRRALVWDRLPVENGQPADRILGQESFTCRDENAGRDPGALGMRWPHGIIGIGSAVLVSDAGNNRIMVWSRLPDQPGVPCDFVLGQANSASLDHNRGRYLPDAKALNMPYALTATDDWLLAADTANSRLIGWEREHLRFDAEATGLAGQPNFSAKGDNRWQLPVRDSLCWPYGVSACERTVVIADSGNNRVLLWELAQ